MREGEKGRKEKKERKRGVEVGFFRPRGGFRLAGGRTTSAKGGEQEIDEKSESELFAAFDFAFSFSLNISSSSSVCKERLELEWNRRPDRAFCGARQRWRQARERGRERKEKRPTKDEGISRRRCFPPFPPVKSKALSSRFSIKLASPLPTRNHGSGSPMWLRETDRQRFSRAASTKLQRN